MLPPSHRLRHAADIARVRRHGRRWRHPLVTLIIYANPDRLGEETAIASRFAFVAGRQVGSAVRRNQVKRRLREIVRRRLDRLAPGRDCLLIARAPAADATFAELESAVVQLLARADVMAVE